MECNNFYKVLRLFVFMKYEMSLSEAAGSVFVGYYIDGKNVSNRVIKKRNFLEALCAWEGGEEEGVEVSSYLSGGLRGVSDAILISTEGVCFDYQSR